MISPDADVYNLPWRNAYVYTVDWEERKMAVRIGEDIWHLMFDDISYSATDDTQAIKMILDRLVVKLYRLDLHHAGSPNRAFLEYVSDILANPYEWCVNI